MMGAARAATQDFGCCTSQSNGRDRAFGSSYCAQLPIYLVARVNRYLLMALLFRKVDPV
jgi:hypothetical protein